MSRSRNSLCLLAVTAICSLVTYTAGCKKSESTPAQAPDTASGQRQMEIMLSIIRQRAKIVNPYFEEASIDRQLALLQTIDEATDPGNAYLTNLQLAIDYRRLGRDREGVKHVTAAEAIADRHDLFENPQAEAAFFYEAGLSWLRLAETTNCVHCRTGESCILPIAGTGIHKQQEGSTNAMKYFLKSLEIEPNNLEAVWLLNIAAMTLGKYPDEVPEQYLIPTESFSSATEFPRFLDVAQDAGLKTQSCGGALVTEDFDNDGLIDVFASSWAPDDHGRLFKNTGDGKFVDITEEAGIKGITGGINAVQGDYDNDGLVDLFIVRGAWLGEAGRVPNSLLRNLGNGKFQDVTIEVGLEAVLPTPTAAWADIDNDGDLDLFVGNELYPCQLYRNDNGKFVDIAKEAGVTNGLYTKAAVWGDYNNDRLPDLYVSNLDGRNCLYCNDGNYKFTNVAAELKTTEPATSFPTWFWDVNNDGNLDIYVASYTRRLELIPGEYLDKGIESETDRLYLGDGAGGFIEASKEYRLKTATEPMGCNFGDLDNDGYPDFYLGTGFPDLQALMPNLMFHNANGKAFDNITFVGGFGHLQKGHGTSFVDLDNDGDQDVMIQMGGAYKGDAFGDVLFENPGFGNHFLRVKLVGTKSNKSAIGARIRADIVENGVKRSVYAWVNSGGSFGAKPLDQQLGLGTASKIDTLEIYWPTSDTTQTFKDVAVDRSIEITEGTQQIKQLELKTFKFKSSAPSTDLTGSADNASAL